MLSWRIGNFRHHHFGFTSNSSDIDPSFGISVVSVFVPFTFRLPERVPVKEYTLYLAVSSRRVDTITDALSPMCSVHCLAEEAIESVLCARDIVATVGSETAVSDFFVNFIHATPCRASPAESVHSVICCTHWLLRADMLYRRLLARILFFAPERW